MLTIWECCDWLVSPRASGSCRLFQALRIQSGCMHAADHRGERVGREASRMQSDIWHARYEPGRQGPQEVTQSGGTVCDLSGCSRCALSSDSGLYSRLLSPLSVEHVLLRRSLPMSWRRFSKRSAPKGARLTSLPGWSTASRLSARSSARCTWRSRTSISGHLTEMFLSGSLTRVVLWGQGRTDSSWFVEWWARMRSENWTSAGPTGPEPQLGTDVFSQRKRLPARERFEALGSCDVAKKIEGAENRAVTHFLYSFLLRQFSCLILAQCVEWSGVVLRNTIMIIVRRFRISFYLLMICNDY